MRFIGSKLNLKLVWAVAVVLGSPLAIVACGNGSAFGTCSINGTACALTCNANVGCAQCAGNGDCGAAKPVCVSGQCFQCGATSDCATGQACYPKDHVCSPACTGAGSCTDPDAPICNTVTGACVGCIDNKDCGGNAPVCDPNRGQCGQCGANADCGAAAPICDLASDRCVQCVVDDQCDGGKCKDNECEKVCKGNADCGGATPLCRTSDGQCVACLTPSDCSTAAPSCGSNGRCVQCVVDADCNGNPTDHFCLDSSCVQCRNPSDCANGQKCKGHECG